MTSTTQALWRECAWIALLVPLGMASGVAATLLSRRWDAPTTLALAVVLALVYLACRHYDWLAGRLAALVWRLRWRSRCLAVAAEWRAAERAWRAPWHAESWAAYARLARLKAQAEARKERMA